MVLCPWPLSSIYSFSLELFEAPGKTPAQELRLFCPRLTFQGNRRPLRHKTVGLQVERKENPTAEEMALGDVFHRVASPCSASGWSELVQVR